MVAEEQAAADTADAAQREQSGHAIYRRFGACRFGFEQALETSPENASARQGLQQVIELLIEREIQQGAHRAASLLIADLPEPNPDLTRRLNALGEQLETRDREFEGLKRNYYEHNASVGWRSRSLYAVVLGVLMGGMAILGPHFARWIGLPLDATTIFFQSFVVLATALVPTLLARHKLMRNIINRNIIYLTFVALVYTTGLKGVAVLMSIPVPTLVTIETGVYSGFAMVAGLFGDRQLLWMSAALGLAAIFAAFVPELAIESLGVGLLVGFMAIAVAWLQIDRRA